MYPSVDEGGNWGTSKRQNITPQGKKTQAMKSGHVSAYFKVRKDTMKGCILCGSDYIVFYSIL